MNELGEKSQATLIHGNCVNKPSHWLIIFGNVLINDRNFYDQLINNSIRKYDKVIKIAIGQDDDYTKGYLLNHSYFKFDY